MISVAFLKDYSGFCMKNTKYKVRKQEEASACGQMKWGSDAVIPVRARGRLDAPNYSFPLGGLNLKISINICNHYKVHTHTQHKIKKLPYSTFSGMGKYLQCIVKLFLKANKQFLYVRRIALSRNKSERFQNKEWVISKQDRRVQWNCGWLLLPFVIPSILEFSLTVFIKIHICIPYG